MHWTNKVSGQVDGTTVQIGFVAGDVTVAAHAPVRPAYLSQVRALAPDALADRDDELALLAAYCTCPSTAEKYLWWQAAAWSGKSALLSWFALHPPPAVRLVTFFVTSRLPGQNDRRAFVDNVLDQLLDIAGSPPRGDLTDSTREPYLLHLLTEVSRQVQARGEHFALVVDGLDEDRGVDGSPDAHSIAALLPRTGVRVIVASRPDPSLPDDVPPEHPLHTSAQVFHLAPSSKANAVRDAMIRDVKRLMQGTQIQRDILGLITAAGALSAHDLAELTKTSTWQIENELRTVAGRSFSCKPGDPPMYILAHEQLQAEATKMLAGRLPSYRDQLREWATTYRTQGWPPNTPRYFLRGHTATLITIGDRTNLLDHVTDPLRHATAHLTFGNHHACVNEIEAAQSVFLDAEEPDLVALARLAVHYSNLRETYYEIPTALPQVWAMAGYFDHAENLLSTINDPVRRGHALISTAQELYDHLQAQRANKLLDVVESMAHSFNQYFGEPLHGNLARIAMRTGDHNRARRTVDDVDDMVSRARISAEVALTATQFSTREVAEQWYQEAEDLLKLRPRHTTLLDRKICQVESIDFATSPPQRQPLATQDEQKN
ncbi:hypothetical protein [Actinokineospora inagensis]|uniref:hypothetical protein n=1 Tax=Actinokineospora inagensis TaxID=103730 RepID=UPI00041DC588|nr:hypothetical protein [Actinokineospora inagensis]